MDLSANDLQVADIESSALVHFNEGEAMVPWVEGCIIRVEVAEATRAPCRYDLLLDVLLGMLRGLV